MPISAGAIDAVLGGYAAEPRIATVGSHSALDIADGAAAEGFRTLVIAQAGRERTYAQYFRARRDASGRLLRGCVDEVWTLANFREIAGASIRGRLHERSALLVPNRALSSYVPLEAIEEELDVPIVGARSLLRIEERSERENYY
ncbi:MAG TPA: DUF1246 domain-containing protein, partial [Candidatus Binatia bacterium]|nr:DUF1246 domain-containing protein [Candidatus Binatia bacterium]